MSRTGTIGTDRIVLEDGSEFAGTLVSGREGTAGPLMITNTMSDFTSALIDPQYEDTILVFTYPQIGGAGLDEDALGGGEAVVAGVIARSIVGGMEELTGGRNLLDLLARKDIPVLVDVDTRALVAAIRDEDVQETPERGVN